MKPEGKVVINNQTVFPPAVNLGLMEYPKNVDETFKKYFKDNVYLIDGQDIARKLGNTQAANVVMVGAFSNFFPELKEELFVDAIKSLLAPKLQDLNVKAFYEGKKALRKND